METKKTEAEIAEQIAAKVAELETKHNCIIYPLQFKDDEGNNVIGYMKNPPRIVKLRVLDKSITAPISAGAEMLEVSLLKEDSDPRISSEAPENDKYYLGACMQANRIVTFSTNQFKKK